MISIVRPEKLLPAWTHGGRCWSGYITFSSFIEIWMINGGVTGFRGYNNRLEIDDV
jgi:hypothetical protein